MISWMWLLPATSIGAAIGFCLAAMFSVGSRGDIDLTPKAK